MTTCQRISEAKKFQRGYHYSAEVYIPKTKGLKTLDRDKKDEQLNRQIQEIFRELKVAIHQLRGEVRVYNDV